MTRESKILGGAAVTMDSGARALACIVMAGGKGTRMRSALPKVLHATCGRPILGWVLEAAREAGASRLVVVTPPDADEVRALLPSDAIAAIQPEARGTGDAVRCGMEALGDFDGDVLVVSSDTPLIRGTLLRDVVSSHRDGRAVATLLTAHVPPPNSYGRVVRDPNGSIDHVTEAGDASPAILAITEINTGFYAFDAEALRGALARLRPDNAQGELYLPDVLPHPPRGSRPHRRTRHRRRRLHHGRQHPRRPGRRRALHAPAAAGGRTCSPAPASSTPSRPSSSTASCSSPTA